MKAEVSIRRACYTGDKPIQQHPHTAGSFMSLIVNHRQLSPECCNTSGILQWVLRQYISGGVLRWTILLWDRFSCGLLLRPVCYKMCQQDGRREGRACPQLKNRVLPIRRLLTWDTIFRDFFFNRFSCLVKSTYLFSTDFSLLPILCVCSHLSVTHCI